MAERILDDETREKILRSGLFPMSGDSIDEFTPEYYEHVGVPEDMRPVFHLRPYTQRQKTEYQNLQNMATMTMRREAMKLTEAEKQKMVSGVERLKGESDTDFERRKVGIIGYKLAVMYEEKIPTDKIRKVVCGAICGWENFLDRNGKAIAYRGGKDGLSVDMQKMLHEKVIEQISIQLEKISGLSNVEVLGLES